MDAGDLEDLIATAPVIHAGRLNGGGGHQDSQLVILDGGVGVVAKLSEGTSPTAHLQIRAERARRGSSPRNSIGQTWFRSRRSELSNPSSPGTTWRLASR